MAVLPLYDYFVYNCEIKPSKEFVPSENEGGVYEVIRIWDGIPLFLEDHLERFYYSAGLAQINIGFSLEQIKEMLYQLINKNQIREGNVLVSFKENLKACFIAHSYPTPEMYQSGVTCGILEAERKNPNAKVFQTHVREMANRMMKENNLYEVVLVDHLGRVTEGSRSNIFFVDNNRLVTAPGNEVLLGITRKKMIELAYKLDIEVMEQDIKFDELSRFQAAAITGTSPKILPVSKIGSCMYDPHDQLVRRLMEKYDSSIARYVFLRKQ